MLDDIEMLKLRVSKFPPRILKDAEAASLVLKNAGWNCELIKDNIGDAISFAIEKRREWLRVRRERRRREREEDRAWRQQTADQRQAVA